MNVGALYHFHLHCLQHLTWLVEGTKERENRTMIPRLKTNAAAGCQGAVKMELLKGAGLLIGLAVGRLGESVIQG